MNPLDLRSVYAAIRTSYADESPLPHLPDRDEVEYNAYRRAFVALVNSVPNAPGIYLWFEKTCETELKVVYVGEAGRNTKGLNRRFREEFKNWHHCFWATYFNSDKYLPEAIELFVESGKYKPTVANYAGTICSDWLKRGATHLIYRTDLPREDLKTIQDDLIQLFGNPRGNIADRRTIPRDEADLLPISKLVFHELVQATALAVPYNPRAV